MQMNDVLYTAIQNLRHARLRTFLCVLAVSIGICAVCIIRGLGSCATQVVRSELNAIGLRGTTFYSKNTINMDDATVAAISEISGVSSVSRLNIRTGSIRVRTLQYSAALCGVDADISEVFSLDLLYGRCLNGSDVSGAKRVILVDAGTAEEAYKRQNIIGKRVTVTVGGSTDTFTVIGVIASQKSGLEGLLGGTLPCIAYMPFTTLEEMKSTKTEMLAVGFTEAEKGDLTLQQSIQALLERLTGAKIEYQNLDSYGDSFLSVSKVVTLFAAGVAGISAVVAGIGVMNTMLSSVDARVYEIGVYLALGAKTSDLVKSFFAETCLICLFGGILGTGIYAGIFLGLRELFGTLIQIEGEQILLGMSAAFACGVLFGIAPAIKVSGKKPIEVLNEQK